MASGYSQQGAMYRHLTPIQSQNTELIATVLGSKQASYNKNLAQIDAALAEYGNIDLAREEDKEYLYSRLEALTNEINGAGMQDLSSSSVTRNITRHIDQAIDDNVIEQVANTKKLRNFQTSVAEVKKSNPEQYSDANAGYAMHQAGLQKWMSGESDQLGNLEYTPYVDVSKEYADYFKEQAAVKHGITRKVPTEEGYFVETEYYGMEEADVRNKVLETLTPQQAKQLEINAWATYGENAEAAYTQTIQPKVDSYKKQIETLTLNMEGKTDAEKAIAQEKVNTLNGAIENLTARKDSPTAMYRFLGTEDLVEGLAATYAPVLTNESYSVNTAALKAAEAQAKAMKAMVGDYDGNKDGLPDVSATDMVTDYEDINVDMVKRFDEEIARDRQTLQAINNGVYNRLSPEERIKFDNTYQKYLADNDLEDTPLSKSTFFVENSNGGKGGYMNTQEVSAAKRQVFEYKRKTEAREKAFNAALEEREAETMQATISTLKTNPNIKITDENGRVVSARDFLKGVDSIDDLSEAKKKALKKSIYSDYALSASTNFRRSEGFFGKDESAYHPDNAYNVSRIAKINGETGKDLPLLIHPNLIVDSAYSESAFNNNFEEMKRDMQLPANLTKEQFKQHILPLIGSKENPSFMDSVVEGLDNFSGINFIKRTGERFLNNVSAAAGTVNPGKTLIIGGEGTQTRADLERAIQNGTYDTHSFMDNSVEDDATLRNLLDDRGVVQKRFAQKIVDESSPFGQNKIISVQASGTREGEDVIEWNALQQLTPNVTFDKKKQINIIELPDDPDYYMVYQTDSEETVKYGDKEEQIEKKTSKRAKVLKRELMASPVGAWINTKKDVQRITVENTDEITTDPITFANAETHRNYLGSINKQFYGGSKTEGALQHLTSKGAKLYLTQNHKDLFSKVPQFQELAERMIDNSHIFNFKIVPNDFGYFDLALQYKDGNEMKTLKTIPTTSNDLTDSIAKFDVMPQEFFLDYLHRLFINIRTNGAKSEEAQLKTLLKLFPAEA